MAKLGGVLLRGCGIFVKTHSQSFSPQEVNGVGYSPLLPTDVIGEPEAEGKEGGYRLLFFGIEASGDKPWKYILTCFI